MKENKSTMTNETIYRYLDNLTILDIEKLAAQGYYFEINDGHVVAMLPEEVET